MKNKYGLLGLISILGFLGLNSDNRLFLSFFCFIVFFQYFWIIPDEMFIASIRKSAANAFFVNLGVTVLSTLLLSLLNISGNPLAVGTALGYSSAVFVFGFSTFVYEWKERRGTKND